MFHYSALCTGIFYYLLSVSERRRVNLKICFFNNQGVEKIMMFYAKSQSLRIERWVIESVIQHPRVYKLQLDGHD